jgi:hypothetical protein
MKERNIVSVWKTSDRYNSKLWEKNEEILQRLEEEKNEKNNKLQENQRKLKKSHYINDEENEIKRKIEIIKINDNTILQTIIEETSKMKTKLNTISTELVHHQGIDQRCQMFVAMNKRAENHWTIWTRCR